MNDASLDPVIPVTPVSADGWVYTRHHLSSSALGTVAPYGVLQPIGAKSIRGSVYFLHGGDGTDEQWMQAELTARFGEDVTNGLRERGLQIVLPNIAMSFLRDPSDKDRPSYWRHVLDEVIPAAEAGTSTSDKTRWITGISMGGHAALSAFLRRPDLFAACGTHFPGLIDFNPFDDAALADYTTRSGISAPMADILAGCFRRAFSDVAEVERHDPLLLARQFDLRHLQGKTIYIDVGTADAFGLRIGCDEMVARLSARGVAVTYDVVEGGPHHISMVQDRIGTLLTALLTRA